MTFGINVDAHFGTVEWFGEWYYWQRRHFQILSPAFAQGKQVANSRILVCSTLCLDEKKNVKTWKSQRIRLLAELTSIPNEISIMRGKRSFVRLQMRGISQLFHVIEVKFFTRVSSTRGIACKKSYSLDEFDSMNHTRRCMYHNFCLSQLPRMVYSVQTYYSLLWRPDAEQPPSQVRVRKFRFWQSNLRRQRIVGAFKEWAVAIGTG